MFFPNINTALARKSSGTRYRRCSLNLSSISKSESIRTRLSAYGCSSLPTISAQVDDKLRDVEDQLCPGLSSNALYKVNSVLVAFNQQITQRLNDRAGRLCPIWKEFQEALTSKLKPLMLLSPQHVASSANLVQQGTPSKSNMTKPSSRTPDTPSKRRNGKEIDPDDGPACQYITPQKKVRGNNGEAITSARSTLTPIRNNRVDDPKKKRFNPCNVQSILNKHCASGLPGSTDQSAINEMIQDTLKYWKEPLLDRLSAVKGELCAILQHTLDETPTQFKSTKLYDEMHRIADEFLKSHIEGQPEALLEALNLECKTPVTEDGEIASFRFVDRVCQQTEINLFPSFRDGLRKEFLNSLHVSEADSKFPRFSMLFGVL
jgi:hypothetical protein